MILPATVLAASRGNRRKPMPDCDRSAVPASLAISPSESGTADRQDGYPSVLAPAVVPFQADHAVSGGCRRPKSRGHQDRGQHDPGFQAAAPSAAGLSRAARLRTARAVSGRSRMSRLVRSIQFAGSRFLVGAGGGPGGAGCRCPRQRGGNGRPMSRCRPERLLMADADWRKAGPPSAASCAREAASP